MNDLTKGLIKRFFKRFGVRVIKEAYYKFEYDRENYPAAARHAAPVIFDVGANIGQSAVWFSRSFPTAEIHAFEPVPAVFERLEAEVGRDRRIRTLNLACGEASKTIYIPVTTDELAQGMQVLGEETDAGQGSRVTVTTVDEYCRTNRIASVQILKTDTEGYDLDVLRGAAGMLRAGNIGYILSEVTIFREDRQHTNLFALKEFLEPLGYALISFYDLHHHGGDGKLYFFNALFEKSA